MKPMNEAKGRTFEKYIRTDLACERRESDSIISRDRREYGCCEIQYMTVTGNGGQKNKYVTIICPELGKCSSHEKREIADALADELEEFAVSVTGKKADGEMSLLVSGLGNPHITPDRIGPLSISKLEVTRHLKDYNKELFSSLGCCMLSAISPGVLGQTGIETSDIISATAIRVKPDLILVIDALAARDRSRLATTIQLSDEGISPGSGIGNFRRAITKESMGVPVISLGIPTVIDVATLIVDSVTRLGIDSIQDFDEKEFESTKGFFVSPKECDKIIENAADIISDAVNTVFGIGTEL